MMRYIKLTSSEIDSLLMMAFYPNRVEKINLNTKEDFENLILKKISHHELEEDFSENILIFSKLDKKEYNKNSCKYIFQIITCDQHIYKMAALKAFDDNKEFIKV